jgi:hypothetical protein
MNTNMTPSNSMARREKNNEKSYFMGRKTG